jgi:hypothetical protein
MITLTREDAHQLLVALQELNKLSVGENAICLPAEIDDAMEVLEARLSAPEPDGPTPSEQYAFERGYQRALQVMRDKNI